MLKKFGIFVVTLMLLSQVFAGFVTAAEENSDGSKIQSQIVTEMYKNPQARAGLINWNQLDSALAIYAKTRLVSDKIVDVDIVLRDYTGDGKLEIAFVSYTDGGQQYLDIFTSSGKKVWRIFSGKGIEIKLNLKTFSITNKGYDGRYYHETYTYQWYKDKFVRTGYTKTYIKGDISEKPAKYDERIATVKALLKARMDGDLELALRYLSKDYREKIGTKGLKSLIPYGWVTAIDIFHSRRGDWVAVVMKDWWGRSRVFKFVPVQEKDNYGNIKIGDIMEIPEAKPIPY